MPHPANSEDATQWIFFTIAGCIILYQMACGWKRGVARQAIHLLALVLSYIAAWTCAPQFVPLLRPLGYPNFMLSAIAGAGIALVVFLVITLMGKVLFKKTSQQSVAFVRFVYGLSGAALALVSGLVFVWMAFMSVRILGAVAKSEITASKAAPVRDEDGQETKPRKPGALVVGLADLNHSLETGIAADVVRHADPIPKKVYDIVDKMTLVLSSQDSMKRFLDFPGAQALVANPKVTALKDDPDIQRDIKARNYMALLKNERVVAAANDPALFPLLKKFELEKALDYSMSTAQKDTTPAAQ
ncbi:MAG: CvpA family protein [Chthoniobacteraceae bacterium]